MGDWYSGDKIAEDDVHTNITTYTIEALQQKVPPWNGQ